MDKPTQRSPWVDGLRAVCVLFVFFVHDGLTGGPVLASLGLSCAVPGFFFAAGLFARKAEALSLKEYALRRGRQLLVPYLVFGLAAPILCGAAPAQLPGEILRLLLGRRNHLFAAALWFLPCLWVTGLLYRGCFSRVKARWLRLAIIAPMAFGFRLFFQEPILPFSANLAVRYLFYYCLGDVLSPVLLDERKRLWRWSAEAVGFAWCAAALVKGPDLLKGPDPYSGLAIALFSPVAGLLGIAGFALLGELLGRLAPVALAGRSSLLFCCTETLGHSLLFGGLRRLGIVLVPSGMVGRVAVDLLLMAFITVVFVLPINRFAPWLGGRPGKKLPQQPL